MKRIHELIIAVLAIGMLVTGLGWTQTVTTPSSCAIAGAYNAVAPTCATGTFCRVQVDVNGQLKVGP